MSEFWCWYFVIVAAGAVAISIIAAIGFAVELKAMKGSDA